MSAVDEQSTTAKRRKVHKVGPYSRAHVLRAVDGRTHAGRSLKSIEAKLLAEIGPKATIAQRLLAKSAALKATRITLLTQKVVDEGNLADGTDTHTLAYMNGLRADLSAMGLLQSGRGARGATAEADDPEADLAAYLQERAAT